MATVQLSDIYNPLVFAAEAQEKQLELNAFISSGIVMMDPVISGMASTGGNFGELPFFAPLTTEEPNYSTDDPTTDSTPAKITSKKMKYRLASQNKSWSVMDISRELGLSDPVGAITGRIGQYWATNNEKRVIATARGVIADNIANDSGDMVFDISAADGDAVTDANKADADAIIDTIQTMGDHGKNLGAIAMHSVVKTRLDKQDLIDTVKDSDGMPVGEYYRNLRVVVDDSLVGITYGTPSKVYYYTMLFGGGQFRAGEGKVMVPSEYLRRPDAGNGGGEERIYSRRSDIIHPAGFTFTDTTVAGQSATQAELALPANWDRVMERKNIALAVLKSNG